MISVSLSDFRAQQSEYIGAAQREPVELLSRGVGRRAVLVSPDFFDAAVEALEDRLDARAALRAREEQGSVSREQLMRQVEGK